MDFYTNVKSFKDANGYEIEGAWYPRVTAIISIKAKPALYRFYAGQSSYAAAEAMKNKSAEEGTLVHEVIESLIQGHPTTIPDAMEPVATAFQNFQSQHHIVPHQVESKIVSRRHGYAGTIDVLAEVDGKLGVLDIKTSQAIYRDYGIQTAAYVEALHEEKVSGTLKKRYLTPLTRWILRLDQARLCFNGCGAKMREKGGTEKIRNGYGWKAKSCSHVWGPAIGEVEFKELHGLEHDTRAFLAAKTLWEWEHDEWLRRI